MDKRIKVLIFIPSLQSGGQERYISILCNHIDVSLFDVTLYVLDNSNAFFTISNEKVKVVDLGIKRVRKAFFKIFTTVKREKPDIVFSTGHHLNSFFAIAKVCLIGKFKLIARESTIVSLDNKMQKIYAILNRLDKIFYKRIDFIICQSLAMQADLIANYGVKAQKTVVINNFVEDVPAVAGHQQVVKAGQEVKIFISVARLSKEKGLKRIIAGLSKVNIPYQYCIFGKGAEKAELEALVATLNLQDKIIFFNETVNPFEKIDRVDLFLMGSHYEGFPNVLLEAGIRGIPVVAFKSIGGANEIIIPGVNGLVADAEDDFAPLVIKAASFPFNKSQIREITLSKYSVPIVIKKVETVLATLATNR